MTDKEKAPGTPNLVCKKCQQPMAMGKVVVSYPFVFKSVGE